MNLTVYQDVVFHGTIDAPDQQVSLTDPDARSMATSGNGTATVGYNVQIAVDAEHHLIVAHEEGVGYFV